MNPGATLPRALLSRLPVKRGYLDRASREFEAALKIQPDEASAGATQRAEGLFAKEKPGPKALSQMAPSNLIRIIREGSQ